MSEKLATLADAFKHAMTTGTKLGEPTPVTEPVKEPPKEVKEPVKEPVKAEPVKEPVKEPAKEPEPAKEAKKEKEFAPELRAELARVKKELEEARKAKSEASFEEIEAIRKEKDALEAKLSRVRYQDSREFQEKFEKPIERLVKKAKEYVSAEQQNRLESILLQPQSQAKLDALEELIGSLPPMRQTAIVRYVDEVSDLISGRNEALSEAGERLKQYQAEESRRKEFESKKQKQAFETLFEDTLTEARAEIPFFQEKEGDEAHNTAVKTRVDTAREYLTGQLEPKELVKASLWAVIGPEAFVALAKAQKAIESMSAELEGLRSAKPTLPSGGATQETKPKSFIEAFRENL